MIAGWACATCGQSVDVATPSPWRCPNSTSTDRAHVLRLVSTTRPPPALTTETNPFVWAAPSMAWHAFARSHGLTAEACTALARDLDSRIAEVDGTGFRVTPLHRAGALSDQLGFDQSGGVWIKDETGNVSGSHKARHLMSILLHLEICNLLGLIPPSPRPRLAIASCGNAALAAATLAAAARWPLDVFVPPSANAHVVNLLKRLGATVVLCPRRSDDQAGDPCLHRFREQIAQGSIPFGVQGPENALALDGGRTIGWEVAAQAANIGLDRVYVQVGGGALVTGMGDGLIEGLGDAAPKVMAVQTAGCAPLDRAWRAAVALGIERAPHHWDACMWPWEVEPASAARGILDDETYDWVGAVDVMARTGGGPVVSPESDVLSANTLVTVHTSIDADHTGTAGLAGLLTQRTAVDDDERILLVLSGIRRTAVP